MVLGIEPANSDRDDRHNGHTNRLTPRYGLLMRPPLCTTPLPRSRYTAMSVSRKTGARAGRSEKNLSFGGKRRCVGARGILAPAAPLVWLRRRRFFFVGLRRLGLDPVGQPGQEDFSVCSVPAVSPSQQPKLYQCVHISLEGSVPSCRSRLFGGFNQVASPDPAWLGARRAAPTPSLARGPLSVPMGYRRPIIVQMNTAARNVEEPLDTVRQYGNGGSCLQT